jgi:tetratricopeptide (TPR) repeat protein
LAQGNYRTLLVDQPAGFVALNDWGNALVANNGLAAGDALLRRAIRVSPANAHGHYNRGIALYQWGRLDDAIGVYKVALCLTPAFAEACTNLGSALVELNRSDEAERLHRRAHLIAPDFDKAWNNLGVALDCLGRPQEARDAYRRALVLSPFYPRARYNLSHVQLLLGDFAAGWANNRWRRLGGNPGVVPRSFPCPAWDGEDLAGRTILLYGEQGLGDVLQFARYGPLIAALGARVVLEVYRPLVRLLKSLDGVAEVVATGDPLPPFDVHLALMEAPRLFATTEETIPTATPYIKAEAGLAARWREKLGGLAGRKVGLAWAGDPRPHDRRAHATDGRRSIRLDQLAPLFEVPGLSFVSLQKGDAAKQLHHSGARWTIVDPMDGVEDFADTAGLIANLDLVITVDTSIAHLAGALGKEVWILSRFDGCWRWLRGRDDSPWYPTARLFRQETPGDWGTVIERVARTLAAPRRLSETNDQVDALFNMAVSRHQQGKLDEARRTYRLILAARPNQPVVLNHLGALEEQAGAPVLAVRLLRRALAVTPRSSEAWSNLGIAHHADGRFDPSVDCFTRAIVLTPDLGEAYANLARVEKEAGNLDAAIRIYRRGVAICPQHAEIHCNLGAALLTRGALREGFREHEWRLKGGVRTLIPRQFDKPAWDGGRLDGKTILLYGEQGFGDVLQFARYAPLLAERGGRVVLETYPALHRLLTSLAGIERVVAAGGVLPDFDVHLSLLSAPFILGTELASVPATIPYLSAPPAARASWAGRLAALPGLKVGLVWAGDPRPHDPATHAVDKRRSLALSRLAPILDTPGITFISLQKGDAAGQLATIAPGRRPLDPTPDLEDFADTAALIDNLDLVVTVDTAVAHLAGALGKPVWILSRHDGCWRWLTDREDSPWYPTARLFRQTAPGDWSEVIDRLRAALRQWAIAHSPVLLNNFAITCNERGDNDLAAALYRQVIALSPGYAKAFSNLGKCLADANQPEQAIPCYRRALRIEPEFDLARNNLAAALVETRHFDAAAACCRAALCGDPALTFALNNLALAVLAEGRAEHAVAAAQRALRLDPAHAPARATLDMALHSVRCRMPPPRAAKRRNTRRGKSSPGPADKRTGAAA